MASALLACLPFAPAAAAADNFTAEEQKYLGPEEAPRFAIVIYEKNYDHPGVDREALDNADTDALKLGKLLDDAGYRPRLLPNPTRDQILDEVKFLMSGQVRQETNRGIRPVVVIYFAGHGYRVDSSDYLAPREFDPSRPVDTGLPLTTLIDRVARDANLLIFDDACRTLLAAEQPRTGEPMDDPRPQGTGTQELSDPRRAPIFYLISYAAEQKHTVKGASAAAIDTSPYSAALMSELFSLGAEFRAALTKVKRSVVARTDNSQSPIVDDGGAVPPSYYFKPTTATDQDSLRDWLAAMRSGDPKKIDDFIEAGGSSRYLRAAVRYRQDRARP